MVRPLLVLCLLSVCSSSIGCSDDGSCPQCADARCAAVDASGDVVMVDLRALDLGPHLDAVGDTVSDDAKLPDSGNPADAAVDAAAADLSSLDSATSVDAALPDAAAPKESDCSDGKDNDGDNKADCLDPDCDGKTCRVTIGFCDAEETCSSGACPADAIKAKGTVCRKGDSCDIEEKCDGTSKHCPVDALAKPTLVCRAPSAPCDHAEKCDGVSPKCPPDILEAKGAICRDAADLCDSPELCDGLTDTCPADTIVPAAANKVCRSKAGPCDIEELCTGSSSACPADLFVVSGATVCRPSVGNCDLAESCDGKGAACPTDAGGCPSSQYCSGSTCVAKKGIGKACSSAVECSTGHCYDLVCCDRLCSGSVYYGTYFSKGGCRRCNKAGSVGICKDEPKGTFPYYKAGVPPCDSKTCDGKGQCEKYCTSDAGCRSDTFCKWYWGSTTKGRCARKEGAGHYCTKDSGCQSGSCYIKPGASSGFCCDAYCAPCCGDCSSGKCVAQPAGTDASSCGSLYRCNGSGGYNTACTGDAFNCSASCSSNAWCWAGKCIQDLNPGAACVGACQCKSNTCFPWVCW